MWQEHSESAQEWRMALYKIDQQVFQTGVKIDHSAHQTTPVHHTPLSSTSPLSTSCEPSTLCCVLCCLYCVLCCAYCVLCCVYCALCCVYCVLCWVYYVLCCVYCELWVLLCILWTVLCVQCCVYLNLWQPLTYPFFLRPSIWEKKTVFLIRVTPLNIPTTNPPIPPM